ncbi:MAG: SpoIIE family protein phosphatase [Cyanobium sp.]
MAQDSSLTDLDDYGQLFCLAGEIAREPNLDGLLHQILEKSKPWMNAEACSIFLPDPDTNELVIHSAQGESAPQLHQLKIPAGTGIVGIAMNEQRIIKVDDVRTDANFYAKVDEDSGFTTRCLIAAPLMDGDSCLGVIEYINAIDRPHFSQHDVRLVEYFSCLITALLVRIRAHEDSIRQATVQKDLDLARGVQSGLLRSDFPKANQETRLDMHAKLIPAYEVSGDLYDFFPGPDGKIYFLVGDVAGKGVAAGLFMAVTRALIRAEARQHGSPVAILQEVNNLLIPDNLELLFVTIILGIYDPESGLITYAQGGHNPGVLLQADGGASYQPTGGQPLGVFGNATFGDYSVQLNSGDSFIVYTDGITEAMNEQEEPYGEDRFLDLLKDQQDLEAIDLNRRITDAVKAYAGAADQSDDITLMTLKRL